MRDLDKLIEIIATLPVVYEQKCIDQLTLEDGQFYIREILRIIQTEEE